MSDEVSLKIEISPVSGYAKRLEAHLKEQALIFAACEATEPTPEVAAFRAQLAAQAAELEALREIASINRWWREHNRTRIVGDPLATAEIEKIGRMDELLCALDTARQASRGEG